jgi:hypothetical protein
MEMIMPAMVENSPQSNGKDHVSRIDDVGSSKTSDKESYNDKNNEEPPPKGLLVTDAREFHNVHHSSNVKLVTISIKCWDK